MCGLAVALAAAGCAGPNAGAPQPVRGPEAPSAGPPAARAEAVSSVDAAARRAARRLERLAESREGREGASPAAGDLEARYAALLDRPGTPASRKPEILLRLAELAYREEEAALRSAYEAGAEPAGPPAERYGRSVSYYARLAEEYPDSPQALTAFYNLGYLYAERGEVERSARAYARVLAVDPDTPYADEIHMRLGEVAFAAGDLDTAVDHYRAVVLAGRPAYRDKALYKLGWCYFNLERYPDAVAAFAAVLDGERDSPEDLRAETVDVMAKALLDWGGLGALEAYLADHPGSAAYGPRLYRLLGDLLAESSRYRLAVAAYEAGVDAYPAAPECLDMEKGLLAALRLLRDTGGMMERRALWPDRYGPGTPWDRANGGGPLAVERDALVEEGLRLAALYHHARAQRGQGGLERAVALYERYLALFGDRTEAGYEMAYAYAQALREQGRLDDAARQYRAVAANPELRSHREAAAYRRIEVLAERFAEDPAALDRLLRAQEEYVAWNPEAPAVPSVLLARADLLFGAGRKEQALDAYGLVVRRYPDHQAAALALARSARCRFQLDRFAQAEADARAALDRGLSGSEARDARDLVVFSVFKQAERLEAAGDRDGANRHFFRLADEFPATEAAQMALYRAGDNLRKAGREAEAAEVYQRLARAYRGTEYARGALALSAQIYAALGDWAAAAESREALYRDAPGGSAAPDALLAAADAWSRAGDPARAAALYAEFTARFPGEPRTAEAWFRRAEALRELGRPGDAADAYARAWDAPADGDAAVYRARAALALGRSALDGFEAVQLRGDLEAAFARKEALLEEGLGHLVRAASLPFADTVAEALFRAGRAFEHLKGAILASERPAGLTGAEREEYDFLLEERAFPLEERAVGYYRRGVEAARKAGVYNRWVARMYARLEVLVPWAYQRAEETAMAVDVPPLPRPGGTP